MNTNSFKETVAIILADRFISKNVTGVIWTPYTKYKDRSLSIIQGDQTFLEIFHNSMEVLVAANTPSVNIAGIGKYSFIATLINKQIFVLCFEKECKVYKSIRNILHRSSEAISKLSGFNEYI